MIMKKGSVCLRLFQRVAKKRVFKIGKNIYPFMPIVKVIYLALNPEEVKKNGVYRDLSQVLTKLSDPLKELQKVITVGVKWKPKGKFLVNRSKPELAELLVKSGEAAGLWVEGTDESGIIPSESEFFQELSPHHPEFLPVSLSQMSPEAHRKWGIAVRRGGQKWNEPIGVLMTGSLSNHPAPLQPELAEIKRFDEEVIRIFTNGPFSQLDEVDRSLFKMAQPEGGWSSHYFLWGIMGDHAAGKLEYYSMPSPGIGCGVFSFSV